MKNELHTLFQTGIHSVVLLPERQKEKKHYKRSETCIELSNNLNFRQTGTQLNRTEPNFWFGQRKEKKIAGYLNFLLGYVCSLWSASYIQWRCSNFKRNSNSQNGENRCSVWNKKTRFPYLHRILIQAPDNILWVRQQLHLLIKLSHTHILYI
jgi:hypothetical protein